MGWLRDLLLGSESSKPPSYGAAKEDPDPIDWRSIEDRLVTLAEEQLANFAVKHEAESFYGLGLDCNSEEGQVLLCLNSRAAQREAARKSVSAHPGLYQGRTEDDVVKSIEWGFGDWKYQGFNIPSKSWFKGWKDVEAEVEVALNTLAMSRKPKAMEQLRESFLEMACRALNRLERSQAVQVLRRDDDFGTLCADHDESPEDGSARMRRVNGSSA